MKYQHPELTLDKFLPKKKNERERGGGRERDRKRERSILCSYHES